MKTLRPVLAMLVFLALAFLEDYILDVVLPSDSTVTFNPVPYTWIAALCLLLLGTLFLLFQFLTLQKQWLTHPIAIAFLIVGGLIIFQTPVMVTIILKFPDLIPAQAQIFFSPRSFLTISGLLVAVTGFSGLLPKQKKR
jgi:hypothetical protein